MNKLVKRALGAALSLTLVKLVMGAKFIIFPFGGG